MKNIWLSLFLVSGLLITGCDKNFEEINTDPNKLTPASMNYNFVFTSAQLITSGNSDGNAYEDWRNNLIYASCMVQHLSSTTGYWAGDKYTFNAGYNSAYWDNNFPNSIKNIVDVVANLKDDPTQANFYQIARIFKVYAFQRMTDMYGDIPYTEAGIGYLANTTSPKYDKQQEIYNNFLSELEDAASKLSTSALNTVGKADLMYQGDPAKWKKFAYSLMVRVAMRLSKVDPDKAKTWVAKAVAGGVMASNADNALISHETIEAQQPTNHGNGWVLAGVDPDASRLSNTFVTYLKSNNDPRLTYLGAVSTNPGDVEDLGDSDPAIQLGMPNGYDNGGTSTNISNAPNWPGSRNKYSIVNRETFARKNAETFVLTYSATQLLLAEAAQRGWITGTAATFYTNGVTAAMKQLNQVGAKPGVSDAEAAAYLAAHPYSAATGLEQINTQYWVATFMDEIEAWSNWRRSDFPKLTPVVYLGNVTNGTIPRRFTYPTGEVAVNQANYTAGVAGLTNGDKMNSKMWWDK